MKKIIPLLLIVCLLLSACANAGNGTSNSNKKINDVAEPGATDNTVDAPDTIEPDTIAPEPFSLYPAYLQLPLGQHVTLDAQPEGRKLSWTSSDPSVATVDENGRITPVAQGETIITCAAADDPSATAACGVLVVEDGNIYLWDEEE